MQNFGCLTSLFHTKPCPTCKRRIDLVFEQCIFTNNILTHQYCIDAEDTKREKALATTMTHLAAISLHELWTEIATGAIPDPNQKPIATTPPSTETSEHYSPSSPDMRAICARCGDTIIPGERVEKTQKGLAHHFHFLPNGAYADEFWPS